MSKGIHGPSEGIFESPEKLGMVGSYSFRGMTAEVEFRDGKSFDPSIFLTWSRGTRSSITSLPDLIGKTLGKEWSEVFKDTPPTKASIIIDNFYFGGMLSFPIVKFGSGAITSDLFTFRVGAGFYSTFTRATINGKKIPDEWAFGATTKVGMDLVRVGLGKSLEVFVGGEGQTDVGETACGRGTAYAGVGFKI
jgi:hypothetical protein